MSTHTAHTEGVNWNQADTPEPHLLNQVEFWMLLCHGLGGRGVASDTTYSHDLAQ